MVEIFNLVEMERKVYFNYPKRSAYQNLKPYGVDTWFVESLTSYIGRLACKHNITAHCLVKDVVSSQISKCTVSKPLYYHINNASLNGIKYFVKAFVKGLEHKTGVKNLKFLTLLTWEDILHRNGIFKKNRAWCPECYNEMFELYQEVYDPLIWFFEQVIWCPKHDTMLRTECPYENCGSIQKLFNDYNNAYCQKCNRWLGKFNSMYKYFQMTQQEREWQTWTIRNIGELLKVAPNIKVSRVSRTFDIFNECFEKIFRNDEDLFFKCIGIDAHTLCNMTKMRLKVPVDHLLKLSYCTGIDVVEFVSMKNIQWEERGIRSICIKDGN
ncbi:TniQ family protein [Bacillus cereus]|nr:TniQ family protein [Bacillus cereus]